MQPRLPSRGPATPVVSGPEIHLSAAGARTRQPIALRPMAHSAALARWIMQYCHPPLPLSRPDLPSGASSRALISSKSPDVTIDRQVLRQRIATSTSTRRAVPTAPSGDGLLSPTRKIIPMTQGLSFYLDALRFPAALTVFVSHYAGGRFSGGLFWKVMPYGWIAMIVVLRTFGFCHRLGANLKEYALGRVARLYSVIVPTFVVTWALDSLAMAIDPRLYGPGWDRGADPRLPLFLGARWTLFAQPGSNLPFWSLNYEAWYYVLFGAAAFLHGRQRILALIAAALLAGPKILLLFPVWLVGVAAWRRWRLVPSQWVTPCYLSVWRDSVRSKGLAASNYSDNRLRSGRHPAIRLTTTLSVRLSHSLSPLSRQSYADNAGDRARSPDPRRSQFRALPASLSAVEFLWHSDT